MKSQRRTAWAIATGLAALLAGCAHAPPTITPVDRVDLPRFMGDWYVIAHIPSRWEDTAYNAVESYALRDDGNVQTTYTYRDGGFDAPVQTMRPVGFVRPGSRGAVWGMQFVWPIKAEYVIVHVDPAYSYTVIGRSARDYAWVMARTPTMLEADYEAALAKLEALGYSLDGLRKVPQRWPDGEVARSSPGATAARK